MCTDERTNEAISVAKARGVKLGEKREEAVEANDRGSGEAARGAEAILGVIQQWLSRGCLCGQWQRLSTARDKRQNGIASGITRPLVEFLNALEYRRTSNQSLLIK